MVHKNMKIFNCISYQGNANLSQCIKSINTEIKNAKFWQRYAAN